MSPERISGSLDCSSDQMKKTDLWSVGVLLYILICGRPPFDGKTNDELFSKINKAEFNFNGKEWDNMADAKNLIYQLLHYEPVERIDAFEAVNHAFFTNILLKRDLSNNNFRAKRDPRIISHLEFFYVRWYHTYQFTYRKLYNSKTSFRT